MSTAHSHDEHEPDAFAIDWHLRQETGTSNIVSYCGPLERVLQVARRAPLCTHTGYKQRVSYGYSYVVLDTSYQLRSMNSICSCILTEMLQYINCSENLFQILLAQNYIQNILRNFRLSDVKI